MNAPKRSEARSAGRGWWSWLQAQETGLVVAILAVLGLIYVVDPGPSAVFDTTHIRPFFTPYSLQNLAHQTALFGVLAVGVAVVIIAGGIDLSIGSMVALSAVVAAKLMTSWLPDAAEAGPWTAAFLSASAVTLVLWSLLVLLGDRGARAVFLGAIPAPLIAVGVGLFRSGAGIDVGSVFVAVLSLAVLVGLIFALRWGSGTMAGAAVGSVVWGLAVAMIAGGAGEATGSIATGSLVVAATALAVLVGLVLGLRWGSALLAAFVASVVVWGLASGESTSANVPIGIVVASVTLALLVGLAIGVGHAFLINVFQLPAFIATLATLAGLRSLAMVLSENRTINISDDTFRVIGKEYVVTIPIFLGIAAVLSVIMGATVLGRHLYALGGNESAARLSGLKTRRLKTIAYAVSGMLSALGGVLFLGNTGSASPGMGMAYELFAITAAVVGGCSLAGGVGSIRGTVLGLILIQIVIKGTGLVVEGIDPSQIEGLVLGIVVVLAVGFNQRFRIKH